MKRFLAAAISAFVVCAHGFDKIALVDGNDFATRFDVETTNGIARILDRVVKTGADTILWRTHSGAIPRYQSREEDVSRLAHPLDIRRLPNISKVHSWVRYWENEPDQIAAARDECARRPGIKTFGVHMLVEEAHWQHQYLGAWNLEHPQYFARTFDGTVEMHHASFAYPEVREHRLAIVREILERKPEIVYLDIARNGRYGPRCDYVKPNIDEWKRLYPGEALPADSNDPRWVAIVAKNNYAYSKGIKEECERVGAKFILAISNVGEPDRPDWNYQRCGYDWTKMIEDGIVDAIAVASISADEKDPFGSTERIFRGVVDKVNGRCKIYFPIRAYNFSKSAPSYGQLAKWSGVSEEDALERLLAIAVRAGADGIILECVDPEDVTYPDSHAAIIRKWEVGR